MDGFRVVLSLLLLSLNCCVIDGDILLPEEGSASEDENAIMVTVESPFQLNNLATNDSVRAADSVTIHITVAQVALQTNITLENTVISISGGFGDNSMSEIVCNNSEVESVGLLFFKVEELTLCDLRITNCGVIHSGKFSARVVLMFSAAMLVLNSTNIHMNNVHIDSSKGTGIIVAYNSGGTIQIRNSQFTNNKLSDEFQNLYGGGGVFVVMTDPGVPKDIQFENCHFEDNKAKNTLNYFYIYTDELGKSISGSGRGGGLYINFQGTQNSKVVVLNCSFVNNSGFIGAGMAVNINRGFNNSIFIANSTFNQNGCSFENRSLSGAGGGTHFALDSIDTQTFGNISVQNVSFDGNCAQNGGGTFLFSSQNDFLTSATSITFRNSTWKGNSAGTGAAVDIEPNTFERLSNGFLPAPEFINCRFISNHFHMRPGSNGVGTFYSSLFNVKFKSVVHFENNTGSALIMVNGKADFSSCNATFINNNGVQGGAIALIGTSQILLGPYCRYNFTQNSASDRGGAIYVKLVDYHDFTSSRSCFIQYTDTPGSSQSHPKLKWNAIMNFTGNTAKGYGNAIFATSLLPCYAVQNGSLSNYIVLEPEQVFKAQGAFFDGLENQIATEGASIVIHGTQPFLIIPGKEYELEVSVVDDLGQYINTNLLASIESEEDIVVDTAFNCISNQTIQLLGKPNQTGNLLLQSTTPRLTSVQLSIQLAPCPPGFSLKNNECACNINFFAGITECNTDQFKAYIIRGFWAGYVQNVANQAELVTSICPLGFCQYNGSDMDNGTQTVALPNSPSEFICGPNRSGIICGDCKENHTVYYHTPYYQCKQASLCEVGWLFYILSELVPVTILFIVVLVLNISFTSGAVNGFILFSQLLDTLYTDASGVIDHPASQYPRLIYGFFNLDFFNIDALSFCILKNASVLDVLAFKYATVLYSLLLIVGVIVFMKYCGARYLGKYFRITTLRNSVIHGLSTFLVLCYTQCIKVSLSLLTGNSLTASTDVSSNSIPRRVWYNGNIEFFSIQHLPYAIPALFCIVTIGSIPPIMLIVYPFSNKVLNAFGCNESNMMLKFARKLSLSKLKPILDSFQGCFKDDFRFFAGLYFLYRWIALLVYAVITNYSTFYITVEILLIGTLLLHAIVQPYVKRWHNILDAFLLANLAFINGFTATIYFILRVDFGRNIPIDGLVTMQQILIYLPIVYIIIYIAVCAWKKIHHKLKCQNKSTVQYLDHDTENKNEAESYNRLEDYEFNSFVNSEPPTTDEKDTY